MTGKFSMPQQQTPVSKQLQMNVSMQNNVSQNNNLMQQHVSNSFTSQGTNAADTLAKLANKHQVC